MIESSFWVQLKKGMSPKIAWTRIENLVATGMPDVNGCYDGVDTWVELKIVKAGRIEVRYSQLRWIHARVRAGALNVFVVAKDGKRTLVWKGWTIFIRAKEAKGKPTTREDEDSMTFEPGLPDFAPVDWSALQNYLFPFSG